MKKKNILIPIFISLPVLCAMVVLVVYLLSFGEAKDEIAGPVVDIYEPLYASEVSIHDTVIVRAIARDAQGVQRVELWVDDELAHVLTSQLPEGSNPFPLIADWRPNSLGRHTLIVRAFNQQGGSGIAAVTVDSLDFPASGPPGAYEVKEGETLEGLAEEYRTSVEEIMEHNPGLDGRVGPGDSVLIPPDPAEEDPPDTATPMPMPESLPEGGPPELTMPIEPSILQQIRLPRLFDPRPAPSQEIQVEAISLEVDKEYDGVACYVSLAGAEIERVPAAGDLLEMGERMWNIAAELGGDNSRVLSIPEEENWLDVEVHCMGIFLTDGGGNVLDLGVLEDRHYDTEWDGRLLDQRVTGPQGWFRVMYRIASPSGEGGGDGDDGILTVITPPRNLKTTFWSGEGYGFNFDYPTGTAEIVDGYHLFRNGDLIRDIATPFRDYHLPDSDFTRFFIPLSESDFYPTCPHIHDFTLTAYMDVPETGRIESLHSNTVTVEGDPTECYERKGVKITFEQIYAWCLQVDNCLYHPTGLLKVDEDGNAIGCVHDCDPNTTWGCPYGNIWINGEEVVDMWGGLNSASIYTFPTPYLHVDPDEASTVVILGPLDDLTVTMKWWDYDVWTGDDRFCHGEHTITAYELNQIRTSDYRRKTYNPEYDGGGGNCYLRVLIEVLWP